MDKVRPCKTSDTAEKPDRRRHTMAERGVFSWTFHLILAVLLIPVWFFVGGAFAIGGSSPEMTIDGAGWLICFLYLAFALVRTASRLATRVRLRSSTRASTHDNDSG